MKSQIPLSGKNKKNTTNLLSAELAKRVLKVKLLPSMLSINLGDSLHKQSKQRDILNGNNL